MRDAVDGSALAQLGAVQLEHLGRGIGHEQLVGGVRQHSRPLARTRGELQDTTAKVETCQREPDRLVMPGEWVAVGRGGGVVLGGPRTVVGDLLVQEVPDRIAQRRSAGTPRVTAAATVAVARARACPDDRAASPANSAVAALGMAARRTGTSVQPRTSTVGAVAPGRRSMRVATAVSTPRKAESRRIRMTAGCSRAPEASTSRMI